MNMNKTAIKLDQGDTVLLQRAIESLSAANGVMHFLSDWFRDKYELTPDQVILPDGTITQRVNDNSNGALPPVEATHTS